MICPSSFLSQARNHYRDVNQRGMRWLLDRSQDSPWIDTKYNLRAKRDYASEDGLRGPDYLYGWIQGRALEALIQHGRAAVDHDPALAATLLMRSRQLYLALDELYNMHGHASFCYDRNLNPVMTCANAATQAQRRDDGLYTYSDLFVVKGLIAASAYHAPAQMDRHLCALEEILHGIECDRFVTDESGHIDRQTLQRQVADFGPRMIAMGAASLLRSMDLANLDHFSTQFLQEVLDVHAHPGSGLISNAPGGNTLNAGHAIELVGLHLETHGNSLPDALAARLSNLLIDTVAMAFDGTGIRLTLDLDRCDRLSDFTPWWSLPETIRAAALAYELTQDPRCLQIWQTCDSAFFRHFWLGTPPLATQMLQQGKPVDVVPATPDLDPGYHTGLSLLSASGVCHRLLSPSLTH